jgi:plastocyanin
LRRSTLKGKSLFAATAAVLALGLGLAACGEDDDEESASTGTTTTEEQTTPAPTGPADATVNLTESEYQIDPADASAKKAGVVEFKVTNNGSITHALEVEGGDVEQRTDDIAPGESATLKVELQKGVFELYCPIDGHKDKGMEGELSVAGATGSAEDSGSEDESGEDDSSSSDDSSSDDSSSGY